MRIIIIALIFLKIGILTSLADFKATNSGNWGTASGGLQMATTIDTNGGFVYGWIRNAENKETFYNKYYLGYWADVIVELHDANGWVSVERDPSLTRLYASVGPSSPRNIERLAPFQVITNIFGSTLLVDLDDFQWPTNLLRETNIEIRVIQRLSGQDKDKPIEIQSRPIKVARDDILQLHARRLRMKY